MDGVTGHNGGDAARDVRFWGAGLKQTRAGYPGISPLDPERTCIVLVADGVVRFNRP